MIKFKINLSEIIDSQKEQGFLITNKLYFKNLNMMRSYAIRIISTYFPNNKVPFAELDSILYIAFVDCLKRFDTNQNKYNIDQALFLNIKTKIIKNIIKTIKQNKEHDLLIDKLKTTIKPFLWEEKQDFLSLILEYIEDNFDPFYKSMFEMKLKGFSTKTIAFLFGTTERKIYKEFRLLSEKIRWNFSH